MPCESPPDVNTPILGRELQLAGTGDKDRLGRRMGSGPFVAFGDKERLGRRTVSGPFGFRALLSVDCMLSLCLGQSKLGWISGKGMTTIFFGFYA